MIFVVSAYRIYQCFELLAQPVSFHEYLVPRLIGLPTHEQPPVPEGVGQHVDGQARLAPVDAIHQC